MIFQGLQTYDKSRTPLLDRTEGEGVFSLYRPRCALPNGVFGKGVLRHGLLELPDRDFSP